MFVAKTMYKLQKMSKASNKNTQDKTKQKRCCRDKCYHMDWITILYIIFILAAIVSISVITCKINSLGATSIVIAFIGILTAFVIMSNYAQLLEVKRVTENELSRMSQSIDDIYDNLKMMDTIYNDITSSYIVEINKIKQSIQDSVSEQEINSYLNKTLSYTEFDNNNVKYKIIEILRIAKKEALKHESITYMIREIADALIPYNYKNNEILGTLHLFSYEFIEDAVDKNRLDLALDLYYVMKKIARITKDYTTPKNNLEHLVSKNSKNEIYKRYLDTLLGDLMNNHMDYPYFDKDIQDYIDQNNNETLVF